MCLENNQIAYLVKLGKQISMMLGKHQNPVNPKMKGVKMKKSLLISGLFLSLVVSGCVTNNSAKNAEKDSKDLIQEKASEAADAQRLYYETINQEAIAMQRKQNAVTSDLVDVDYIGLPQEFLKTNFAPRYGYSYHEEGSPKKMLPINIRIQKANALDIIKNVGFLVGKDADVIMNTVNKTITFRYLSN